MRSFSKLGMLGCALLLNNSLFSQSPGYQWAKSFGDTGDDLAWDIAADADGNSFVCGSFKSSTINIGTTTLVNYDASGTTPDAFFAKYDAAGNLLWAKSAGLQYDDAAWGLTTDPSGNVIITGFFYSPYIVFDSDTLFSTSPGMADVFVAKYNPTGSLIWARSGGGNGPDGGRDVYTDSSENVFVAGWYNVPSATFDGTTLPNSGNFDAFLLKYDSAGSLLWARGMGGNDDDRSYGVSLDPSGNAIITGISEGDTCWFGSSFLVRGDSSNVYESYVAKYDPAGNFLWTKSPGTNRNEVGYGVACDPAGNIFSTGYFYDSTYSAGGPIFSTNYNNIFLHKQDPAGNTIWIKVFETDCGWGYRVETDNAGSVFLLAHLVADSIVIDTQTLYNNGPAGSTDFFIAKFDSAGSLLWIKSEDSTAQEQCMGIAVNADGTIYGAGGFLGATLALDAFALGNFAPATGDVMVFRLGASTAAISDLVAESGVAFYPNPFSSSAIIELTQNPNPNTLLSIFDVTGRQVQRQFLTQQRTEIQKGDLNPGMYLYTIVGDPGFVASGKLIIQ